MNKRIAFISEHASPLATLGGVDSGGQNVYVDKVSRELVKQGYTVDIFTRWDNRQLPHIVDCQNGIRVIHIKAGPVSFVKKEEMLPYMSEFTENMLKFIESEHYPYSLMHANFFMSGLVAAEIKKITGIPFVITFHALGKVRQLHQGKNDEFPAERLSIEKRIVREADQIIAECPQDREDLIYHYKANQDKITLIPCGFDPYEFYPIDKLLARMTLGLPKNEKIILQLGRMVPRKGVDIAIEGLANLIHIHGIKSRLIVVGGSTEKPDPSVTPEIGRLMLLAQKLNVSEYIQFEGRRSRDQLKYYYAAADVFISTPWYEPFGITPLEAMACGTPVIGSHVGGIKFTVINGKTGFLVPPKDSATLGLRLKELFENEKLYTLMQKKAIERVNTFFTWETVAQSLATLYEKIMYSEGSRNEFEKASQIIDKNFNALIEATHRTQDTLRIPLINAGKILSRCLAGGGKVLLCGNGGSAMDAQHFAVELVGHFILDRRGALPVLALNTDTSILTAVGNDFSFEEIFSRQVEAFGQPGDVFIGISTSGDSENVMRAMQEARRKNMICIGLLGKDGGKLKDLCDISLIVPTNSTQQIQELHTHLIHSLCEIVESQLFGRQEQYFPMIGMKGGKSTSSIKSGDAPLRSSRYKNNVRVNASNKQTKTPPYSHTSGANPPSLKLRRTRGGEKNK